MSHLRYLLRDLRLADSVKQSSLEIPSLEIEATYLRGELVRMALSTSGLPALLLPVSYSETLTKLPSAGGIDCSFAQYKKHSGKMEWFLQLSCLQENLELVFLDLVQNICNRIREGGKAIDCITGAISEFLQLLESGGQVDKKKALGLFGELSVLDILLGNWNDSAEFWTGPLGGRKDFVFPNGGVEVKTSERSSQKLVTISSIDQLSTQESETLFLWYVRVEENPGTGECIGDLVDRVKSVSVDFSKLDVALSQIGYGSASSALWNHWRWSIMDTKPYIVNEHFPRLTNESFADGKPAGVLKVSYEVNLDLAEVCVCGQGEVFNMLR